MTPLALIPAMLLYPWEEIEEDLSHSQQALTDYMREGERAQVQWVGNPMGFGFGGEPSQDAAMMMFEGPPATASGWLPGREVGIDFTFSIGKDLSILYVLGDDQLREKIDRARTRAIERTMAVAERDYMRVRRGSGKDEANRVAERAGGLGGDSLLARSIVRVSRCFTITYTSRRWCRTVTAGFRGCGRSVVRAWRRGTGGTRASA